MPFLLYITDTDLAQFFCFVFLFGDEIEVKGKKRDKRSLSQQILGG
jgi:hypothetical protein